MLVTFYKHGLPNHQAQICQLPARPWL